MPTDKDSFMDYGNMDTDQEYERSIRSEGSINIKAEDLLENTEYFVMKE